MAPKRDMLPDEQALLREARELLRPLPPEEPRAGFAARVALAARDERRPLLGWLRWSLGGVALASAATLSVVLAIPRSAPVSHGEEVLLAQRLELYEDMDVLQHQEALEDLDVVEALQTLQEAKP